MTNIKVGSVFRFAFSDDLQYFYKINAYGVHALKLSGDDMSVKDRTIWRCVPLKNASNITFSEGRLFVSNTIGELTSLHAATGKLCWKNEPRGEGEGPLVLHDGALLQTTWGGECLRIDTASGRVIYHVKCPHKILRLFPTSDFGKIAVESSIQPAASHLPITTTLRNLDTESLAISKTVIERQSSFFAVDSSGRYLVSDQVIVETGDKPQDRARRLEVIDLAASQSLSERVMTKNSSPTSRLIWSPRTSLISFRSRSGSKRLHGLSLVDLDSLDNGSTHILGYSQDGSRVVLEGKNDTFIAYSDEHLLTA